MNCFETAGVVIALCKTKTHTSHIFNWTNITTNFTVLELWINTFKTHIIRVHARTQFVKKTQSLVLFIIQVPSLFYGESIFSAQNSGDCMK